MNADTYVRLSNCCIAGSADPKPGSLRVPPNRTDSLGSERIFRLRHRQGRNGKDRKSLKFIAIRDEDLGLKAEVSSGPRFGASVLGLRLGPGTCIKLELKEETHALLSKYSTCVQHRDHPRLAPQS